MFQYFLLFVSRNSLNQRKITLLHFSEFIIVFFSFLDVKTASEPMQKLVAKVQEMQVQRNTLVDRLSKEMKDDQISQKLLAERDTDETVGQIVFSQRNDKEYTLFVHFQYSSQWIGIYNNC